MCLVRGIFKKIIKRLCAFCLFLMTNAQSFAAIAVSNSNSGMQGANTPL